MNPLIEVAQVRASSPGLSAGSVLRPAANRLTMVCPIDELAPILPQCEPHYSTVEVPARELAVAAAVAVEVPVAVLR